MPEMPPSRPATTRRIPIAIGAVVAVGVIGLGAFYGLGGFKRGTAAIPPVAEPSNWPARSRRWRMARWPR